MLKLVMWLNLKKLRKLKKHVAVKQEMIIAAVKKGMNPAAAKTKKSAAAKLKKKQLKNN